MRAYELYDHDELAAKPTLHQGQCCDCKVDTGDVRVWLCRVGGGVTVEKYNGHRWESVSGGCMGDDYWDRVGGQ